ncbi:MAG TPA: TonB-dependent receptor [Puia sp.]|nr:TonB-dependent receptor [Puia sp.]
MDFRKIYLLGVLISLFFTKLSAQSEVRGIVMDRATQEPLEQATITEDVTGRTAITDIYGKFFLKTNAKDTASITVFYVGCPPFHIKCNVGNVKFTLITLERKDLQLKDVVITANSNALYTTKILSALDLNAHPAKSAQDLLRLVPGLFISQHQGGGKAEQIFLRGFDCDHGTDINISVDGVPVNLVAHAHGQGYADLHFLIPETIADYQWGKGPFYANKGDFTTGGFVSYNTKGFLDNNFVRTEGGLFNTGRVVAGINLLDHKAREKGQSLYLAGEGLYSDGGPFTQVPEHFKRYNFMGKFVTPLNADNKLTVEFSTLWSKWRSSGEIPERAPSEGYMDGRWGTIDSFQTGYTTRTNAIIKLNSNLGNNFTWKNEAFYSNYNLSLYTNFTFYYFFPDQGDEFRQGENRNLFGYHSTLNKTGYVGNTSFNTEAAVGFRTDLIDPVELDHTERGVFLEKIQYGNAKETNIYRYIDENIKSGNWLFNIGLRYDYFNFYYLNMATDSFATKIFDGLNPKAHAATISPKINIEYTFNPSFQLYLKTGKGFHSNDVRVVIAQQGKEILPSAYATDFGFNWKPFPKLFINAAVWYLLLQSEFTYGSDLIDQPGGPMEPSGRTVRYGIDFSGRFQVTDWLYAAMNINLAHPRSIDDPKGENYLPLAPTFTSTGELNFKFPGGWNGGISYRYLHDRAGNEDYSLTARGYFVTDLAVNYTKKKYEIGLTVENLFDQKWDEAEIEYTSRLKNETVPVDQMSYIPGVPFFPKLRLTVFF